MYTLQQSINYAKSFIEYTPLSAGTGGEPAITTGNIVIATMTSAPLTWGWNRAEYTGLTLTAGEPDYNNIPITNFKFLEKVTLKTVNGNYAYELKDVYNTNVLGLAAGTKDAQPKSVCVKYISYATSISLRFLAPPDQDYTAVLTYQKLPTLFTPVAVPASQQTGSGIPVATTLSTGSVLAFTDGISTFTYTTQSGDTINSVISQINSSSTFTASANGNLFIINASSQQAIFFTANTLTDALTEELYETFNQSGTPALINQNWPIPDDYTDVYNTLFLAEAFQCQGNDQDAARYRQRGIAALLAKSEGLSEIQRNAFLSQFLIRDAQVQAMQLRTQQGNQARAI